VLIESAKISTDSDIPINKIDAWFQRITKLWMYTLEIIGLCWIYHFVWKFSGAINMVKVASNKFELQRANDVLEAVKIATESTSSVILAICAAVPGMIAAMRVVKKKINISNTRSIFPDS